MSKDNSPYKSPEDKDDGGESVVGAKLPTLPPRTTGLGVGDDDPRTGMPREMVNVLQDGDELRAKPVGDGTTLSNGLPVLTTDQFPRLKATPLSEGRRHRDGSVTFGPAETTVAVPYECPGCGDVAHSHDQDPQRRAHRAKEAARVPTTKATNGILKVDGKSK
jgi:hypothetical protein